MRQFFFLFTVLLVISGIILMSCATEEPPPPEPTPVEEHVEETAVPEPEPEPEPEVEPEPVPEPEPEPVEEVVEEPEPEEEFIVTEDVYEQTFTDIESLIAELNAIIKHENYEVWTTYLTKAYKASLEDPEQLSRISEEPILKKYNIRLSNLKDYFFYVVVPSRSDARLDDIVFVDESHVKAIMIINNRRSILYKLEKIDDKWKIGDF